MCLGQEWGCLVETFEYKYLWTGGRYRVMIWHECKVYLVVYMSRSVSLCVCDDKFCEKVNIRFAIYFPLLTLASC